MEHHACFAGHAVCYSPCAPPSRDLAVDTLVMYRRTLCDADAYRDALCKVVDFTPHADPA
jgi:hypothetical protein